MLGVMIDVTEMLKAIENGDPRAAEQLLPLVYHELRQLAAARLANEKPGQTLQATALVHEAYLRLVQGNRPRDWNGRGHFFAAAAEAMRRILVETARRKGSLKRGGKAQHVKLPDDLPVLTAPVEDVLAVDEALDRLADHDAGAAQLVKLHYFAGLTLEEAADAVGIPHRTAYRTWAFARAWLYRSLGGEELRIENPQSE
jgi:RNA polymerase sigma factor (TIGR02999 family)